MENKIIYCPECDMEEIAPARLSLGYRTCLTCGEAAAQAEVNRKRGQIAIAYPKGAYQYITDMMDMRNLG